MTTFNRHQVVTITLNPAIDKTLIIPHFASGKVNRVERTHTKAGGKGVNVAAALADHGIQTAATGFLGQDNATVFESFFSSKGIEDFFLRVPGNTRMGLKIVDPATQATTDINFPGIELTPEQFEHLLKQVESLPAPGWAAISGSLPPGVPTSAYRTLIRQLKAAGCKVALDTSGDAFSLGLEALPHFIKPNRHELSAWLAKPLPDIASLLREARRLIQRGIEWVVVSMDAEGALFVTREGAVSAVPPAVKIHSTVGAGDAMVAGVIAAQLDGLTLAQTAALSTGFSLDLLTRHPDDPVSLSGAKSWASQVEVRPLPEDNS